VFMDARGTVTAEEGDRYPLKPPNKELYVGALVKSTW
jgi:hypothetical protein